MDDLEVDRRQFDELVRIIRFVFGELAVAAGADFRKDDSGFLWREHLLPVPRMAQFPSIGAFLFLPGFFLFEGRIRGRRPIRVGGILVQTRFELFDPFSEFAVFLHKGEDDLDEHGARHILQPLFGQGDSFGKKRRFSHGAPPGNACQGGKGRPP